MAEEFRPLGEALTRPSLSTKLQRNTAAVGTALRKNKNMAFGAIILVIMTFGAISAPLMTDYSPTFLIPKDRLLSPSSVHYFGTDQFGRDVYTRVLYGARVSLLVGISVAIGTVLFSMFFGILSGYNNWLDWIIMRIADALMSIPSFLLAIALLATLGAKMSNVILALIVTSVPGTSRFVRSFVLSLREQDFILASRSIGAGPWRIMFRHMFPNIIPPVLVLGSLTTAGAILAEAGLSFLGAGIPPGIPSWGNMMGDGREYNQVAVWILFFPGLFLSLTVLGANLVGDGLRDTLDPRLRRLQ